MKKITIIYITLNMLLLAPTIPAVELFSTDTQQLQFTGYFRAGVGVSEGGTRQAKFSLSGTRSAYRLGNEPDTNVELTLQYAYIPIGKTTPKFKLIYMQDGYAPHGSNFKLDHRAQSYVQLNDILADADLWLGRRYYDRKFIHLMDHSWLNSGQGAHNGVGLKNITMPTGSLDLALFRYHDNGAGSPLRANAIDARWRGIPIHTNTELTAWAKYVIRDKNDILTYNKEKGIGLGVWIDYKKGNVTDTLAILYQSGPAIQQADYNARPIREDQIWDLKKAKTFEINNVFFYEILPKLSVQWSLLFRTEERGIAGSSRVNWLSTGIRPIYYLTDYINLALEASVDYVDDKINNRNGHLSKITVAMQIAQARGFYQRPVLRLFVTTAQWSNDFSAISAPPYNGEKSGWSSGIQAEWWW